MGRVAKPATVLRRRDQGIRSVASSETSGERHSMSPSRSSNATQAANAPDKLARARSAARNPSSDQLNNRIFFRLFQLGNELQRKAVQQLGITTVQWAVLGALSQERFATGIPLTNLGEYLVVTRQNLDGVLKRLERDGLVRRVTPAENRRARVVQLTQRGQEFWAEILQRIYLFYDQASAQFTFDQKATLVHYLNELQKDLARVELPKSGLPKRDQG